MSTVVNEAPATNPALSAPAGWADEPAEAAASGAARMKIAKLEIFDDCEVAIRMETGQW